MKFDYLMTKRAKMTTRSPMIYQNIRCVSKLVEPSQYFYFRERAANRAEEVDDYETDTKARHSSLKFFQIFFYLRVGSS